MTQQLIQKHRNAIGQLERARDDLIAEKKVMAQDLQAQREVMQQAIEQLVSGKARDAWGTLKAALEYRIAQRTPRGEKK